MSSLLDKIAELEQKIVELKAEVEKEEKENKRWRAEDDCTYWFVGANGKLSWSYEYNRESDDFRYDTHNYFQTEYDDKAQKYAKVLETERQLRRFADEHNGEIGWSNNNSAKRYLSYNYSTQSICTRSVWTLKEPRVIYFSSKEIAQQAIDTIGEDKIKEYLTYEW